MIEITEALLHKLYIDEKKSLREIGLIIGKSKEQTGRYLKKYNIPARPFSSKGLRHRLGKKFSPESIAKMKKSLTGRKLSPEHKAKVIKKLALYKKGQQNPNWKGGRTISNRGYIWIKKIDHPYKNSQGYVSEHRLVMEAKLGRYLLPIEHIHHINEIKTDNRIENLRIVSNEEHMRLHWTKEKKLHRSKFMIKLRKDKFWSSRKVK